MRLIVAATLYETVDVRQVWSQQFDRPDNPDERNAIIAIINSNFGEATVAAEAAHAMREHPNDLDKRDLMVSASSLPSVSKENYLAKIALVDRALALDPNYVWALRSAGRLHADLVITGLSSEPDADVAWGMKAVERALLLAPNDVETLRQKSRVLRAQGNLDGAAALLRKVIALEPLHGYRYYDLGVILLMQGQPKEALENFMTAKRFPWGTDPVYAIDANLAIALVADDRYPEAIAQARLAIAEFPPESGRIAEFPWLALDRSRKRQWAGRGGACGLGEVPRHPANLAHHGRDPEVRLLHRQSETA